MEGNLFAVRRPGGSLVEPRTFGEVVHPLAVGIHGVDVGGVVTGAHEGYLAPARRPVRINVASRIVGEAVYSLAVRVHSVDLGVAVARAPESYLAVFAREGGPSRLNHPYYC